MEISNAKAQLAALDIHIAERKSALDNLSKIIARGAVPDRIINLGLAMSAHIGDMKELRYQLSMTPEKVMTI